MSARITRDEWLQALGTAAQPTDPDALTTTEIAAMFGIARSAAERRIKDLVAQGKAIRTVKLAPMINGHSKRVTAYKLVKGKR